MDQFINIKKHKKYNVFARENISEKIVDNINKKETFCLYGKSGVGKTFLINKILNNFSFNELHHDILRSKTETLNFIELSKNIHSHILIDDVDTEYYGWKELVEYIKKGKKITRGSLIIVIRTIDKIDFCQSLNVPSLSFEELCILGNEKFPRREKEEIEHLAEKSNGNLRNFFHYFDFPDEKDIFFTPKEMVHNLICPSEINPSDYIGKSIEDHGFSWGIVHENYPRSPNISLEDASKISDHMSTADMYDNAIYRGDWELCSFFCHEGIIAPAIILKQGLCRETLNPGSAWTKYNNYKMRMGKLKDLQNRQKNRIKIDIDFILVLRDYCQLEKIGVIPRLLEYNFKSQDMDLMNHLALKNKIKPKLLINIKKELKKYDMDSQRR
jgi:hypothetical protein